MFSKINEDQLTPECLTKKVLGPMKYGGCRPGNRTWWENLLGVYYITYSGMIVILFGLSIALDSNMGTFIEKITMLFGFLQVAAKCFIVFLKGDVLLAMLNSVWDDFWLINRLDDEHKKSCITLYTFAKRISDLYSLLIIAAASLFVLQAILKMNKSLIHEVWLPHKEILKISPYYEITMAVQAIMLLALGHFCITPIDQLFINFIFCVCVQFKMLREEIKLLNIDNNSDETIIQRFVDHHNILIRFLEMFEEVFSKMLLATLASNYITMTMALYAIINEESINQKAAYLSLCFVLLAQILAYCSAGQLIHDQSLLVAETAYEINWYKIPGLQTRKDIMTIIVLSQREIELTAGGIVYLNMENFLKIVKTTFSLLAFLFSVQKVDV